MPNPPPTFRKAAPPNPTHRYVCVHGHFYQPPRENPWLETVELQESAAPYHDWNDRITLECYAPNGASRITNDDGKIIRILNNYARMSFNFGPTLLSWLHDYAPRTYRMVLDADRASAQRYGDHGSAIAQVYNHIIMPLATERDALTQIRWGIADFQHRFGRRPEGMWLAETAVSRAVLDLLAREGIRFTILAPHQCARVRPIAEAALTEETQQKKTPWQETANASVDPRRPYRVQLDEGRSIAVFFYDGPASRSIAFEGLLDSGEAFGKRLVGGLDTRTEPQLSHVATDGESYGHHHKHGEMALSFAMQWIEESHQATLTNYGEFLANFPPRWEAEVVDNTSWSCAHGIERWRSNCGCNSGKVACNQEWRGPLRAALDDLRDASAALVEAHAASLLHDVWAARDEYIQVILNRVGASPAFFARHATHTLTPAERVTVLELMELERHTQLMYTSCGWFFDEISGIETVQVIAYAGRVLQLAAKLFGEPGVALEPRFLTLLAEAKSNLPEFGDGAEVYRRLVTPMRIGLEQVGAHYAISSIFRNYPEEGELFCFDLHRYTLEVFTSGRGRVAIGRAQVRSRITEEAEDICFAVLHLGDQNLSAAVKRYTSDDQGVFDVFSAEIRKAIRRANLPEIIRLIDRLFGPTVYSLTSLFADEQQRILRTILNQTLAEMEDSLRKIYEDHSSLLHFLSECGVAKPPALALAASFAINASLRHALESEDFDANRIATLLESAHTDQVTLDEVQLSFTAGQCMKRAMVRLEGTADQDRPLPALYKALAIAEALGTMPIEVNLWQAQNIWNDLLHRGDSSYWPQEWKDGFKKLGEAMNISVDQLVVDEGVSTF